jgi:hypothetical protein
MIATVVAAGTGAIATPTGWTAIKNVTQGTALRQASFYKVATASEAASYSWNLSTSRAASGGICNYNGVNTTVPVDATASAVGESGNATAPAVTTSDANDQVLVAGSFAAATTVTPAAGTNELFDVASSANTTDVADFAQATAGATTARTITPAVATGAWIAQTIALRDAAAATLTLETSATPTFTASLNSGDATPTFTVPLTVKDSRTGASGGLGWNATVTSTQFKNGTRTLSTSAATITAVSSTCLNGGLCTTPTNAVTYPLTVPAAATAPAAVKFYNAAANTGKGLFTVTPTVKVAVPQNSFSGAYTSTLTISIVSGP